jgi:hypothetical protein
MDEDLSLVEGLKWKFVTMNLLFAEYSRLYTKYFFRHKGGSSYVILVAVLTVSQEMECKRSYLNFSNLAGVFS